MTKNVVETLRERHPACSEFLEILEGIAKETDALPLEEFFEPTSVIMQSDKESKLLDTTAANVKAWTLHIAYSARLRLRSLEDAVLSEVVARRVVPAMVLARSHMEVAGLAVLCNQTLYDSQKQGDNTKLQDLMLKTSLGTAMRRMAKHDQHTEELLLLSEQATITISNAINALDTFRDSGAHCRRAYALLCEYAHPNPRANKEFYDASGEVSVGGWQVLYHPSVFNEDHARMILRIVSDNARSGHAAAEILRLTRVFDAPDGFAMQPPDGAAFERIWTRLMHMPPEQDDE